MTIQIAPHGQCSTGAVMGVYIKGHDVVEYIRLSVDFGHGDPQFVYKQGIPEATLHVKFTRKYQMTETGVQAMAVLKANGVNIKNSGYYFIELAKVSDLPAALRILSFDEASVRQIESYSREAARLRQAHSSRVKRMDWRQLSEEAQRIENFWANRGRQVATEVNSP